MKKFFNRERELELLKELAERAQKSAQMTFMIGPKGIGKTSLLIKASAGRPVLYFFIAKKHETLLVEEFVQQIQEKLDVEWYGDFRFFKDVFGCLMELSRSRSFTLILDEFQEFNSVSPAVYSEVQNLWDSKKTGSRLNLVLCGSVYSLMSRIFEHAKEPLFGRATARIHVQAFSISTLKEIIEDYYPDYSKNDLLAFYVLTGGVAKYVELLIEERAFTFEAILDVVFNENSLFLEEGKNVLIDEFGKDHGNYFSILGLLVV